MNLKEFLEQNKVIKESALAVLMWPDKNNQAKVFSNKINEKTAGSGKQRITEDDEARAKVVLLEVADKIKAFAGNVEPPAAPIEKPTKEPAKKETPVKKAVTPIKKEETKRIVNLKGLLDEVAKDKK